MNEVQTFANNEFGAVRSMLIDEVPWFADADAAKALKYNDPPKALMAHVDDEDKNTTLIQGSIQGNHNMTIIREVANA